MDNWKENFSEYTSSVAFQLSLSKPQCDCLRQMRAESKHRDDPSIQWIPFLITSRTSTLMSLTRKGLIQRGEYYELTPAGLKVCELLDMVFGEYEEKGIRVERSVKVREVDEGTIGDSQ